MDGAIVRVDTGHAQGDFVGVGFASDKGPYRP